MTRCIFLVLLLLTACGDLPQPFLGNPGVVGARLAQPPPSRLAVQYPAQSLLPDQAAAAWAQATAAALLDQEIPADARRTGSGRDWSLTLSAEVRGQDVVPSYTVNDPAGEPQGLSEGAPVPLAAWASGRPEVLQAAAVQAAPGIASLLNRIEAARRQSDPNSLVNRPARVFLAGVTGAPGDGNRSLPMQLRLKLQNQGLVVQDTAKDADFEVRGDVVTAPGANRLIRVELQWVVTDPRGERGRVVQINEVPAQTINPYWGDVAVAVATEAAGGVKDVILNATGRR